MDTTQLWLEVRRQRCQLADRIEAFDEAAWNSASWCKGWRVRDVLGHLVHLSEATQLSMGADIIRGGLRPDRALSRAACRLGNEPVPELCQRLRVAADGRYHVLGSPAAVVLGEVLVHGSDVLRPVGMDIDSPPLDATTVLDAYWKLGRLAFHPALRSARPWPVEPRCGNVYRVDSNVAREVLLRHILAERDRDVDAAMATVSANPSWRLLNRRVEGPDAVRDLYERSLPLLPDGWFDEYIRALDDPQITHWGDAHCVIEYSDEYAMHRGWVIVIHFDEDGMIRSENAYPPPGSSLPTNRGADSDGLPGVVRPS